jgi:hypothetical protein
LSVHHSYSARIKYGRVELGEGVRADTLMATSYRIARLGQQSRYELVSPDYLRITFSDGVNASI